MAKWQRVKINIPKRFGPVERQAIAQDVIDFIVERTKSGKNVDGKQFPGYSKSYTKSLDFKIAGKSKSKVDLTLSEEMLNSIGLLNHSSGELLVGFDKTDDKLNGKAEGNQLGTYGQPKPIKGKARPFLGISSADLKKILSNYPETKDDSVATAEEKLAAAQAAGDLVDGIDFKADSNG